MILSREEDTQDAILTIHPGAGGRKAKIGSKCFIGCMVAGQKKKGLIFH